MSKRVAYLIGISDYKSNESWKPLKNPINDVFKLESLLKKCDFTVKTECNPNKDRMNSFTYDFETHLEEGYVGLFYFAGHGVEINGKPYLIPIDAKKTYNNVVNKDILESFFDITKIIYKLSKLKKFVGIFILDCCREQLDFYEDESTRGVNNDCNQKNSSDTLFSSNEGIFISFSTGPNSTASDGSGDNSRFVECLSDFILTDDLKIEELFKKTRVKVINESKHKQIPWEHSSLVGDFYFRQSICNKYNLKNDTDDFITNIYNKKLTYTELEKLLIDSYRESLILQKDKESISEKEFLTDILFKINQLYIKEQEKLK